MTTNKFGLTRNIPESIKRAVRQRDGFGCIRCGMAIIEYEHLEPEFSEAREHSADGIVLLCGSCHSLKTRRRLSSESLKQARDHPKARSNGFSFGPFDVGQTMPEIHLGTIIARDVAVILKIFDDEILSIENPEVVGGPFLLNALLFDSKNKPIMKIVRLC